MTPARPRPDCAACKNTRCAWAAEEITACAWTDGILIKGNHLRLVGGIRTAVERARQQRPAGYHVEVEITSLAELDDAIRAGADGVLLDNMTPEEVHECVNRARGRVQLEVSGGIDASNIRAYAETGVDYISVGALTHSAAAVDINFRVTPL